MKNLLLWAVALTGVAAYPHLPENFEEEVERPFDFDHQSRATPAMEISKKETNCGPAACTKFEEAKQFRSTTGKHAYQSPAITDIRGPCPGLNAAANHGYIPRNGLMGYYSTIEGMFDMYSLSREFNAFLVAYAILMTGDLVSMKWSIGGPQPYKNLGGALAPPQGISFSHNKYEGDVSIGRNDAYMANGDAHSLNVTRFRNAFEAGMGDNRYTLHKWRGEFTRNVYRSIRENPYYFSPPFAGAAVSPAAYNFAINFMSNHSAEEPSGYLDAYNFKQFFAVRGNYPNFRWVRGQERIPDNWYARPASEPYGAIPTVADVALTWAVYPKSLKVGGNTGKKDSYVGVDLGQLTGGTFTAENLLQGNNAGCFIFLSAQEAIPDQLKGGVNDVAAATALFKKVAAPIFKKLGCGQLGKYDSSLFEQYPGNSYNPTGKPTNY